ncbi:MAG: hypothetical protein Q7R92_00265 [bacterium]|nr:hypothetical protein [bacterium]
MLKIFKSFIYFGLIFLFCFLLSTRQVKAQSDFPPAPTLIAPNEQSATADLTPIITGLTRNDTSIKIYIDGVIDGEIGSLSHVSGTASFSYRPSLNLTRGRHKLYAIALNPSGAASQPSAELNFTIEWPMPAPTMIKATVNRSTVSSRPFITGLAKNNSLIKVYIDKKYSGEFLVKNHPSGTANFAYRPATLSRGSHQAYAVAMDRRGKASINSNGINFSVKAASIAQAANEQRKSAVANIKNAKTEPAKEAAASISPGTGKVEEKTPRSQPVNELINKEQSSMEQINNLLGTSSAIAQAPASQGLVNEGTENQSKLKLSLILFILFLVGVVAWLLWVNRELIRERRAQNEPGNKAEDKKDKPPDAGQENKLL